MLRSLFRQCEGLNLGRGNRGQTEVQKSSVGNGLQWGGSRLMWMGWVDVPNKGKAAGMGMVVRDCGKFCGCLLCAFGFRG